MKDKTLLEIGAEGGSMTFVKRRDRKTDAVLYTNNRGLEGRSLEKLLRDYSKSEDPLLWYYPVEVDLSIRETLLPILLEEYRNHQPVEFMNLTNWEEKLQVTFSELAEKAAGFQTFIISPVEKRQVYGYNHFGEERVLEVITTEYQDQPKYKTEITGIGTIEGNTLVIRNENEVITGVFPLERYEVKGVN